MSRKAAEFEGDLEVRVLGDQHPLILICQGQKNRILRAVLAVEAKGVNDLIPALLKPARETSRQLGRPPEASRGQGQNAVDVGEPGGKRQTGADVLAFEIRVVSVNLFRRHVSGHEFQDHADGITQPAHGGLAVANRGIEITKNRSHPPVAAAATATRACSIDFASQSG